MAVRDGRSDVKQTTTGFRDPRHHICRKQIPIPKKQLLLLLRLRLIGLDQTKLQEKFLVSIL